MTQQTATLPQTGTWTLDPAHTVIGFSVKHLMAAKVRGSFKAFDGSIEMGETPEESSVTVSIDAASIDTGVEDRDNHLRSPDFLEVEQHPTITFRSTKVERVEGERYRMEGELTIRGVTKPVTLDVTYLGMMADPWGNEKAMFNATTRIDREDWGLTWNQALEAGGWLVGKQIDIELEVQAQRA